MFDGKAFGQEVVGAVKAHMEKALAPVLARMDAIETRLITLPSREDADPEVVAGLVISRLSGDIIEIRSELDAIKPNVERFAEAIGDEVAKAAAKAIAELPKPADGHSPTPEELAPLIDESVQRAVSAIPMAKDGKDGKDGRDGDDVAGILIDRSGHMIVTLSNGLIRDCGRVVGRNGKDGAPGKDGRDGVGFDELETESRDGGRILVHRYKRGGEVLREDTFKTGTMVWRGIFNPEQKYEQGDTVTWGGSTWHCDVQETTEKPDSPAKHWTLSNKRGRDGKDGVLKAEKPKEPVKVG